MKISRRTQMILAANAAVVMGEVLVLTLFPFLEVEGGANWVLLDALVAAAVNTPVLFFLLRKSELDLEVANRELGAKLDELNAQAAASALISEVGELMLVTRSLEETYEIVARYAGQAFPGTRGSLYVLRHSRNLLEQASGWGEASSSEPWFAPDECMGFRRGKQHQVMEPGRGICCGHVSLKLQNPYCCVPMIANGEALGMLHIEYEPGVLGNFEQRMLSSLVELIALALSNNHMQQKLKA